MESPPSRLGRPLSCDLAVRRCREFQGVILPVSLEASFPGGRLLVEESGTVRIKSRDLFCRLCLPQSPLGTLMLIYILIFVIEILCCKI